MNLNKVKKVYMIGVKGVGMTMLAQYLAARNIEISGSDGPEKYMTDSVLSIAGVKVIEKFDSENIPENADLIIYSTAYNAETNVEVAAALKGKIKILSYAEILGEIFNKKYGIAVVGSHGKTTTTAWLGYVMKMSGIDPSVMVGARVPQFAGCSLVGKSDYLAVEADEYQNKLKYYMPKAVLLNNIDYDHPDFFKTKKSYENVFAEFVKKIPPKGFLIANFDDSAVRKIAKADCGGRIITYSVGRAADYAAYGIRAEGGRQYFKVKSRIENEVWDFSIRLAGNHNIYNALAVIAACRELKIDVSKIKKHLGQFKGAERRMQILGQFKGAEIIDDYAHHPTEIKAVVGAIRQKYGDRKLIAVFHPHTFTRTKALFKEFVRSFSGIDELIVMSIYGSAREKQGGVSGEDLVEAITRDNKKTKKPQKVSYIPSLEQCEKYLREHARENDVIVLIGAGDIFRVGKNLIKK
ncbi:MAG: UDP-N-acetylmuramate--L-alanine ligase [bacterium]